MKNFNLILLYILLLLVEGFLYFLISDSIVFNTPPINSFNEFIKLFFIDIIKFMVILFSLKHLKNKHLYFVISLSLIDFIIFLLSFRIYSSLWINLRSLLPIITNIFILIVLSNKLFKLKITK